MNRIEAALVFAITSAAAAAVSAQQPPPSQGRPPATPTLSREQTWPAPTAEDWKKPCLIRFQRTWEDAVAVAREEGKLILVCVNMDGEIASEHYAGVRYRDPAAAKLYEPYVCVLATTYRHTPRDHDENGERILCPRFGSVTCGEHISIEPFLFENFMEGQRVAPRHIAVELDEQGLSGKELHDVFYAFDVQSVLTRIETTAAEHPPKRPVVKGDRPLIARVQSRDNGDRAAVESAYRDGDATTRLSLIEAALKAPQSAPVDLLRLALFGMDRELAAKARDGLAQSESAAAVPLIEEALRGPLAPAEKMPLLAALERLGGDSPRARTLSVVHQGLAVRSSAIDLARWTRAAPEAAELDARAGRRAAVLARQGDVLRGSNATAMVELAEALLDQAQRADRDDDARWLLADMKAAAEKAMGLGAHGYRPSALLAVAARAEGDESRARALALQAVTAGAPEDPTTPESLDVLELFARERELGLGGALRDRKPWPPHWLADLNAAYAAMIRHPLASDDHIANHYDVLDWLGAGAPAGRFLAEGLERFPDSDALHQRLRSKLVKERGGAGLLEDHAARVAKAPESATAHSHAGYAALVAAEFERRAGRSDGSALAYDQAIAWYGRAIELAPEDRGAGDHFVALGLAGKARLAFEAQRMEEAVALVEAAFSRAPRSAATLDGLNVSPVDTAKMLVAHLDLAAAAGGDAGRRSEALSKRIKDALESLKSIDPSLLELPAYERGVPRANGR
jgi:tetratricopeptide (TPR) repeat protein